MTARPACIPCVRILCKLLSRFGGTEATRAVSTWGVPTQETGRGYPGRPCGVIRVAATSLAAGRVDRRLVVRFGILAMQSGNIRVYRSAVDFWLVIVIYSGPAALLSVALYSWAEGRPDISGASLMAFAGLVLLFRLLTSPCRYTLTDDSLNIRCGILFRSVPLSRVRSAELSSTWESAPAMSLRRVKIVLDQGHRIVSPVDRQAFIADLMAAVEGQTTAEATGSE